MAKTSTRVEDVFRDGGLMSRQFPDYEPRKGQIDMALAIESAIDRRRNLIVEAPTGTGKSLAYSAPCVLAGGRTIIVTANIALQEQLVHKDLPLLAKVLPEPFRFVLVKGISNYLCLDKLGAEGARESSLFGDATERTQADRIRAWAEKTTEGDVSELPFTPEPSVWSEVSVSSDECKSKKCQFYDGGCYAIEARRRARQADVVVTNYHLFFAHLALMADSGIEAILPPADRVVCDEAHKCPDIARDFFGFSISPWRIARIAAVLDANRDRALAKRLRSSGDSMFAHAEKLFRSGNYRAALRDHDDIPVGHLLEDLRLAGDTLLTNEKTQAAGAQAKVLAGEIEAVTLRTDKEASDKGKFVYFLEERGARKAICICRKPIDAADALHHLFVYDSVILTSATLSTFGRFDYVKKEFGAPADRTDVLEVESPFDFMHQALLVVPDMPLPTEGTFADAVAHVLWEAIQAADGRTLGLFTSYRNMNRAYDYLVQHGCEYRLLRQGDAPRTQLVADFKEDTHSVLLGTESFWAGIDCPGETLSCIVMDRLPFASPDDPVMDAIAQRDQRWFFNHSVPQAIIQMKQGFGRLIRTRADRGVCVMLDARLYKKAYGASFLKSLPRMQQSNNVRHITPFLKGV